MQAVLVMFAGREVVRVEVLHVLSGSDLRAVARMKTDVMWDSGFVRVDTCRIYPVQGNRLVLGGSVNVGV